MKRLIRICVGIVLIAIICIIWNILNSNNTIFFINWNIKIPKAYKVDVIYSYEFRDGEDLEIWHYDKRKIEKMINSGNFTMVDEKNQSFIIKKLDEYHQSLDQNEKNLFESNVDINSLVIKENYFLFLNKNEKHNLTWTLLILDFKNKQIYYFNNVC